MFHDVHNKDEFPDIESKTSALLAEWFSNKQYSENAEEASYRGCKVIVGGNLKFWFVVNFKHKCVLLIDCDMPYQDSLADAKIAAFRLIDDYLDRGIVVNWR